MSGLPSLTYYNDYAKKYNNAIESIKNRKKLKHQLSGLEENKKEKLVTLKRLIQQVTDFKSKQNEMQKLEKTIEVKKALVEQRRLDIEKFNKICAEKKTKVQHHAKYLGVFRKEFSEEFKIWEKKWYGFCPKN
jgi:hypothetical protein